MKNLSVIVPYRNGQETLSALLDSLPSSLPVIVVDDLSESLSYVGKHRKVDFLRLTERGYFSGAVNAGIAACTTDVLILNQDVTLEGKAWQKLLEDNRDRFAIIGDGVMNHPHWPKGYVQGTFMFMRRDALDKIGGLNAVDYPLWGATAEWQLRASRAGFEALPLDDIPGLEHARGQAPFGSSIKATLEAEPAKRATFIRTPPEISVIIPSYNYGRYLRDAVNSLIGGPSSMGERAPQTFQSFEIVIVNDASTDETDQVALALADEWKAIRYVKRDVRGGTAAANNSGIEAACGRFVTHLSADDMMQPDRLEYLFRAAVANPGKMIYDDLTWFRDGEIFFEQKLPEYDFETLVVHNTIHAGIFYTRDVWQKVGGYPELMANGREDWAMNLRLGRAGCCGVHVPRGGYLYRREKQNRTLTNTGAEWVEFFQGKMRQLFPDLYRGERPMGCCGGGRVPRVSARNGNGQSLMAAADTPAPEGMVRVEYLGGNAGTQEWRGAVSRRRYAFNAGGKRFGYVEQRDLETGDNRHPGLLELRVGLQVVFQRAPLPAPEPVLA